MKDDKSTDNKQNGKGGKPPRNGGKPGKPGKFRDRDGKNPGFGKDSDQKQTDSLKSRSNDPAWYSGTGYLLDSANMSFSYPAGSEVRLGTNVNGTTDNYVEPGLMVLHTSPAFPFTDSSDDPLNQASFKLFLEVRKDKSGSTVYDPVDFTLFLCAMADVFSYINFLQRAYACMWMKDQQNKYMPRVIVEAMGIDYDDLLDNLADFRLALNELITSAAQFALPGAVPIFRRRAFMYQNIYIEGTSIKNQMYMYSPVGFYTYNQNLGTSKGGSLQNKHFYTSGHGLHKWKYLITFGRELLQPMLNDTAINTMNGDIRSRFGDNVLRLVLTPEVSTINPVFDIAVLEQMKNSILTNGPAHHFGKVSVVQNDAKSMLNYKPVVQYRNVGENNNLNLEVTAADLVVAKAWADTEWRKKMVLTTTSKDTDKSLVMENSRLMVTVHPISTEGSETTYLSTAADVVEYISILQMRKGILQPNERSYDSTTIGRYLAINTSSESSAISVLRVLSTLASYRFHPRVGVVAYDRGAENLNISQITTLTSNDFFDVDNYTLIDSNDMERMNNAAWYSLLGISE